MVIFTISAWSKVSHSRFVFNLGRFILPVICGLLLSTATSMILANVEIGHRADVPASAMAWGTIAAVAVLHLLQHRTRLPDVGLVILAGATSLALLLAF